MSYRDLPPGRLRGLVYTMEREHLDELSQVSTNFQRSLNSLQNSLQRSLPDQDTFFTRARRAAFYVQPSSQSNQTMDDSDMDYSDMPHLEIVQDMQYEYLSELPNVILNLVNNKLIEQSSVSMNHFSDNFCVICQENIQIIPKPKCIMRLLKCTHCFHIDCIDKWFTTNKTCPTCKYTFD